MHSGIFILANIMIKRSNRLLGAIMASNLMEYFVEWVPAFLWRWYKCVCDVFLPRILAVIQQKWCTSTEYIRVNVIIPNFTYHSEKPETVAPQPSDNFPSFFIRKSQSFDFSSIAMALLSLKRCPTRREVCKKDFISESGMHSQYYPL